LKEELKQTRILGHGSYLNLKNPSHNCQQTPIATIVLLALAATAKRK